jgi:hypothetical protein
MLWPITRPSSLLFGKRPDKSGDPTTSGLKPEHPVLSENMVRTHMDPEEEIEEGLISWMV